MDETYKKQKLTKKVKVLVIIILLLITLQTATGAIISYVFLGDNIANNTYVEQPPNKLPINSMIQSANDMPAVIDIVYINASNNKRIVWGLPGMSIKLSVLVIGPLSSNDKLNVSLVKYIINETSLPNETKREVISWEEFTVSNNISSNETIWLNITNPITLDSEKEKYGVGDGDIYAYYVYVNWTFSTPNGTFETNIYDGLEYPEYSLHMYGYVSIEHVTWYNKTDSSALPINAAKPGWEVYPNISIIVHDGPVWNYSLSLDIMFDITEAVDDAFIAGINISLVSTMLPGRHYIYPLNGSKAFTFVIPTDKNYGTDKGEIKGIYARICENYYYPIYYGNVYGEELIMAVEHGSTPPFVSISLPKDGYYIVGNKTTLYATIIDVNSQYSIAKVEVYINERVIDITSSYVPFPGYVETTIEFDETEKGLINITVIAYDNTNRKGSDFVLVFRPDPLAMFPPEYKISKFTSKTIDSLNAMFQYLQTLTWKSSDDTINITVTPIITFSYWFGIETDVYCGLPKSVSAGQNFTAFIAISDPALVLRLHVSLSLDTYVCYTRYTTNVFHQNIPVYDEEWVSKIPLELGLHTYNLREDIPLISEYIYKLTHFEIDLADYIPKLLGISKLVDAKLIIDIIPILKILNSIYANLTINGTDVSDKKLTWVDNSFAEIVAKVNSTLDGTDKVMASIENLTYSSRIGMSIGVNLTAVVTAIGEINMNQWLYDNLGILIPEFHKWLPSMDMPMNNTGTLTTNVNARNLFIDIAKIFANETNIILTVTLTDDLGNPVTNVNLTGTIGDKKYNAQPLEDGNYEFVLPYIDSAFIFNISATKNGYLAKNVSKEIYIDPVTVDSTPPSIIEILYSSKNPTPNMSVTVTAKVNDELSRINKVILSYTTDNVQWTNLTMQFNNQTGCFTATIPAQPNGTTVTFKVYAFDNANNVVTSETYTYTVVTETSQEQPGQPSQPEQPSGPTEELATYSTYIIIFGMGAIAVIGILFALKKRR